MRSSLDSQVAEFWKSEDYPKNRCTSDEEEYREKYFKDTICRNEEDEKKKKFQEETEKDCILNKIIKNCKEGWPCGNKINGQLKKYLPLRSELQVIDNIVFLNNRIVVPYSLRCYMFGLLHERHFGVVKTTKSRAREVFYWPSINKDTEDYVTKCRICEKFKTNNVKEPMVPHQVPNKPFSKIAADIGEYGKSNYLIIFYYFSKWLQIVTMKNKTAEEIINKFKICFATHGVPDLLVSDNEPFSSFKMRNFAREYNFNIVTSSPRYPKSNGLAESGVKIAKNILKKSFDLNLALLNYRVTPIEGSGSLPAQLIMNRSLKTKIPVGDNLLKPNRVSSDDAHTQILEKQAVAKHQHDKVCRERKELNVGKNITIKKQSMGAWRSNKKASTPRSYIVK
ncbi:hypothetical protein JTB14_019335 [Gonioctena quinquepunctata]|nr:hypothetical protein JTB14_019335 [Gonioctena quinquepunctata]